MRRYGVSVGSQVLIATNNDSAYGLATDLKAAGVAVLGIADSRHQVPNGLRADMQLQSIPVFSGSIPIDTAGFSTLAEVTLGRLSRDGSQITSSHSLRCDALAVSGGFNPALQLFAQAGGKLAYDGTSGALWPVHGSPGHRDRRERGRTRDRSGLRVSPVGDAKRKWVDLLHDVTVADLELALRENYTSIEHVKRYTTVGMAADQGKTSTPATLDGLEPAPSTFRARTRVHDAAVRP